jgi:predicted nucleic acid-binding protein
MATGPTSSSPSATLDASFIIGYCAKEPGRHAKAQAELTRYASSGWLLFAPGVAISESLYILCQKLQTGLLTTAEHSQAVLSLETLMQTVKPPPGGEHSLIARAEQIRATYGCGRSADSIYLALTEQLAALGTAEIVTFDPGMNNQAKKNAPTVKVNWLPP